MRPRAGRLARSLWAAVVVLTTLSILTTLGIIVAIARGPASVLRDASLLLAIASFATVGAVVAGRRPRNALGWLFSATGLGMSLAFVSTFYAQLTLTVDPGGLPGGVVAAWLPPMVGGLGTLLVVTFVFLLFPDGRLPSRRWRPVAWLSGAVLAAMSIRQALVPRLVGPGYSVDNPLGTDAAQGLVAQVEGVALMLSVLLCLASLVVRFRRSHGDERQQLKWLTYAGCLLAVFALMSTADLWPTSLVNDLVVGIALALIPIAAGIAILKYRLYDIDVVISKTVVFAGLAGFITVVYVGIVVGVGGLVGAGGEPNLGLSVAATAVVAVAFGPVRERVQRVANRLVYGVRATPYEVLSAFSARMGETVEADELLGRMARLLAQGTGAARARVWLRVGDQVRPAATWPDGDDRPEPLVLTGESLPALPGADAVAPVVHHGQLLGALTVTKARGETLTPTDEALIADLAAQAGLVLRNVRLTAELLQRLDELRASRQRLVAAQDSERRRLERDLHDGAQQQLVALKIKLALARTIATREHAERAAQVIGQLATDADDAITTLRDLARGIYPPLLAAEGLEAALAAQAAKAALPVAVSADGVARYPQDTEACVYFTCLEALQNTTKYARASQATITLTADSDHLVFTVTDDGVGFDPATTTRGAGLTNITDRLDALGGSITIHTAPGAGTTITGRLPVTQAADKTATASPAS